jgi:hypothetical protein
MRKRQHLLSVITLSLAGSCLVLAQQAPPPPPMSFFVTSAGPGKGGDLGGLAGADAHCQKLAVAAGSDKTWHAYLSTQGPGAINARDRIGSGPWYNAKGARIAQDLSDLNGDTAEQARKGNNISRLTALTEKGDPVNGVGSSPNMHDMLTGSQTDGRAFADSADHTCQNWTSSTTGSGSAQLGHHDRTGGGSWNSAHPSAGCSQADFVKTGGNGFFYCFATN